MADTRRRGQLINLAQRRRRRQAEALIEAKGHMIEAEHALFVALRLVDCQKQGGKRSHRASTESSVAALLPLFPRGKRAA